MNFRKAREAGSGWNLFKTVCLIAVFWSVFLYLVPVQVMRLEAWIGWELWQWPGQSVMAFALFGVAGSGGIWSGVTMAVVGRGTPLPLDTARELVVRGPYAWVRNPMAIAGLTQGAAVGTYFGSVLVWVYCVLGGFVWHIFVRPVEEDELAARFGATYETYRSEVACWIPRRSAFVASRGPVTGE